MVSFLVELWNLIVHENLMEASPAIVYPKLVQTASIIVIISLKSTILYNVVEQIFFTSPNNNSWRIMAQIPSEMVSLRNQNQTKQFIYDKSERLYTLLVEKGSFIDKMVMFEHFSKVPHFKSNYSVALLRIIFNDYIAVTTATTKNIPSQYEIVTTIINWFDLGVEGIFKVTDMNMIVQSYPLFYNEEVFPTLLRLSFDCCREEFMNLSLQEKEPFMRLLYSLMEEKEEKILLEDGDVDQLGNALIDCLSSFCDALLDGSCFLKNDDNQHIKGYLSNVFMNIFENWFIKSNSTNFLSPSATLLPVIAKMNLILEGKIVHHLMEQKLSSENLSFTYWILWILADLGQPLKELLEEVFHFPVIYFPSNFMFLLNDLIKENIFKVNHELLVPFLLNNFSQSSSLLKVLLTSISTFDDACLERIMQIPLQEEVVDCLTIISTRNEALYSYFLSPSSPLKQYYARIVKQFLSLSLYEPTIPFLREIFNTSSNIEVANDLFIFLRTNSTQMVELPFSIPSFLQHCITAIFDEQGQSEDERETFFQSLLLGLEAIPEVSSYLLEHIIPLLLERINSCNDSILLHTLPLLTLSLKRVGILKEDYKICNSLLKRATFSEGISDLVLQEIISFLECIFPLLTANSGGDFVLVDGIKIIVEDDDSFTDSQLLYQISPFLLMMVKDLCERGRSSLIREKLSDLPALTGALLSSTSKMQVYRLLKMNKNENC